MEVAVADGTRGPWMRPLGLPPSHRGNKFSWGSDNGTHSGSPALPVSIRLDETPRDFASPRPLPPAVEKDKPESPRCPPPDIPSKKAMYPVTVLLGCNILKDMCENCYVEPEELKCVGSLGEGAYAAVDKCEMSVPGQDKALVAVKHLKKEVLTEASTLEDFMKEFNVWKKLQNTNVVEVLGIGCMDTSSEERLRETVYIVQEYMDGGSLKEMVHMQMRDPKGRVYSKADAFRWFAQISEGLAYLHEAIPAVIHRDLKLENILLKGQISSDMQAKVVDFGFAPLMPALKRIKRSRSTVLQKNMAISKTIKAFAKPSASKDLDQRARKIPALSGQTGSLLYMAPEVFLGKCYDEKADVFSLSVVMYEVLRARPILLYLPISEGPAVVRQHAQKVADGFRPPFPSHWPQSWKELISSCWADRPEDRPAMALVAERIKKLIYSGIKEVDGDVQPSCCCSIQ